MQAVALENEVLLVSFVNTPKAMHSTNPSFVVVPKKKATRKSQSKQQNKQISPRRRNMFEDLDGDDVEDSGADANSVAACND